MHRDDFGKAVSFFFFGTMIMYEGELIRNHPNLFPVEIHLFFFDVIALECRILRSTVFKCHQPRTKNVRVLSIGPLLNSRHAFFVRPEMTSMIFFFKFGNRKKSLGDRSGK